MGRSLRVSIVICALSAAVAAQPKASDKQIQQAGELVKKAIAKSQAGDHNASIDLYLQAYNIVPNPILLSNIGSEYQALNKPVQALKYFCKYLEADPTGTSATFATAQARVLFEKVNNGATVDDDKLCKPLVKEPPKKDVVVAPPPPPPDSGSGSGSSTGSSDQVTATKAPIAIEQTPSPSSPGKGLRLAGLGITTVGLGVLGVGIYYGLKGKSLSDQIDAWDTTKPWPATIDGIPIKDWESEGRRFNKNQTLFTVAGGVTTVAGVVLYVIGRSKASSASEQPMAILPTATPDSLGVTMSGAF